MKKIAKRKGGVVYYNIYGVKRVWYPKKKTYRKRCIRCKKMFNSPNTTNQFCPSCYKKKRKIHYGMGA